VAAAKSLHWWKETDRGTSN